VEAFAKGGRAIFLDQGISVAMRGRWSFLEIAGAEMRWSVRESSGAWRRTTRSARPSTREVSL
jgi:hypothetical protein